MQSEKRKTDYLWILYIPAYFISFFWLEQRTNVDFHIIHCGLDDRIPFVEAFIIPYYLWFAYVFITVGMFFILDRKGFRKLAWYLALGMTTFLIVSYVYPNMLNLRPDIEQLSKTGIFARLVKNLYTTDTATNVLPSIHVYNSICVFAAVAKSSAGQKYKALTCFCFLLSFFIILSTMFLKQHSVIDVAAAFLMAILYYIPVYCLRKKEIINKKEEKS